jgi:hypothetical protein
MEFAASDQTPLIITTDRGRGDTHQPTCRGSTRTEHVLLSPGLYAQNMRTSFLLSGAGHISLSDHTPLRMDFRGLSGLRGVEGGGAPTAVHSCTPACAHATRQWSLAWKDEVQARATYTAFFTADASGKEAFAQAIEAQDANTACATLMGMIAAAVIEAGMTRQARCPMASRKPRTGLKRPPWFNDQCKAAKAALLQGV